MEKKIKLLLVADTYYPKVDGTLKFMEEFIKKSKNDFNISLLIPNFRKHKNTNKKSFFKVSKFISLSDYPSMKFSFRNFKTIKKSIKENDLIFIQGPALASYVAMYYGKKYRKKVVTYIHVITWELFEKFLPPIINKLFLKIFRKISIILYNRCNLVIVPYHDLKDELIKKDVLTGIKVARLGVDIDRFNSNIDKNKAKKKLKINPKKKVIGYVGRVSKEKNVHTLVEAFQRLPDQEKIRLLIVGDGPKDVVENFKKIRNCTVTGFVNNVEDYLQAMDIFVMPSLTETTSLATLEAMSCGLPVIATKVGFIKNYIIKDYNGLFFPRENPGLLSIKLKKLLDNEALQDKLAYNARKTIAYSFSWERSINRIKRILKKEYYGD